MAAGAMVASVVGSMAALASMAVTLALCYLFWRKRGRSKDAKDELEPLQVAAHSGHSAPKSGAAAQLTTTASSVPSRMASPSKGLAAAYDSSSRQNADDRMLQRNAAGASPSPTPSSSYYAPSSSSAAASGGKNAGAKDRNASPLPAGSEAIIKQLLDGADDYERDGDDEGEIVEPAGKIQFSLEYDFYSTTLALRIIQGKDLPAKDVIGTSDPYVKVTLLPDKKRKLETKVKHRTLDPRWNETFYFQGFPLHKLQKSILHLNVYDWDRFSRDDPIGDVYLPLDKVDFTQKPTFWKKLTPAESCKLGDLLIGLMYVTRTSELWIAFIKARRLKAKDITGASDPYVKVWHMRGEKRVLKHKTEVHKNTLEPVFEECFPFNVPWQEIRETSLVVTVMDWDHVGRNEPIGGIVLSSKSGPAESRHWNQMLAKPKTPVYQWHKLKPV